MELSRSDIHPSVSPNPMATSMLLWLLCLGLTLDAALAARKELRPRLAADGGICTTRVLIYGYPCEDHTVTTEDGYILGIQRIPSGRSGPPSANNKVPVLLHHGLLMIDVLDLTHKSCPYLIDWIKLAHLPDGITWLLNSPDESLAYILADNGYDVWIANSRGTVESLGHTTLSSTDPAYWDWSSDELAYYDLPATMQYIYNQTNQQEIHFVAHSLGTLNAIAAICEKRLQNTLRSAVLLSPIAYMDQMPSPFARAAADLFAADVYYWLGLNEFDTSSAIIHNLQNIICKLPGIDCYDLMAITTGPNCCLNLSTDQIYDDHEPQATSTKTMVHLSQMIRTGTVTKYDCGNIVDNMAHYGVPTPPAYNISSIPNDLPLFIGYGGKDELADPKDVEHLLDTLKFHDVDKLVVRYVDIYAHADLSMGVNAKEMPYDSVMAFFQLN